VVERCAERGPNLITQLLVARTLDGEPVHQRLHDVHHEGVVCRELFRSGPFGQASGMQAAIEAMQQVLSLLALDGLRPAELSGFGSAVIG